MPASLSGTTAFDSQFDFDSGSDVAPAERDDRPHAPATAGSAPTEPIDHRALLEAAFAPQRLAAAHGARRRRRWFAAALALTAIGVGLSGYRYYREPEQIVLVPVGPVTAKMAGTKPVH